MKKIKYFKNALLIFWIVSLGVRSRILIMISGCLFAATSFSKSLSQFRSGDKNSAILNLLSTLVFLGLVYTILKFI